MDQGQSPIPPFSLSKTKAERLQSIQYQSPAHFSEATSCSHHFQRVAPKKFFCRCPLKCKHRDLVHREPQDTRSPTTVKASASLYMAKNLGRPSSPKEILANLAGRNVYFFHCCLSSTCRKKVTVPVTARLVLPVSHRFKQLACKVWPPVVANSSHHGTIMVSADSREPRGARQRSNARRRISVKGKNENT
jgi:hypothetical protein